MKVQLLSLFASQVAVTGAFVLKTPKAPSPLVLGSTPYEKIEMFPPDVPFDLIQGGGTIKTYPLPEWAERVQYKLTTNGRPMKATVELWLGPIRRVHQLVIDSEDGNVTPFETFMKFKKMAPVLKISTGKELEFPLKCAVTVPSPERAEFLGENTEKLWKSCTPEQKLIIQGGSTEGGGGAIRSWKIPTNVESVQLIGWAKDVGKKSFRMQVEILQGPNCKKQDFMLQCGGGSQPYHAILQTPGPGWVIRMRNLKFVEDGKCQFAVLPYDVIGEYTGPLIPETEQASSGPALSSYAPAGSMWPAASVPGKQWWE